jgi:THO complex subunit 2
LCQPNNAHTSPQFYTTFWQLTLYDIYVPTERYQAEIKKQKSLIAALDNDPMVGTREDMPAHIQRRKREKDRALSVIETLNKELNAQQINFKSTQTRLETECRWWFASSHSRLEIINLMMQECIRPRCMFSASDAIFCARFIVLMHQLGTFGFSTLSLFDRVSKGVVISADGVQIFGDVGCTIFACTQNEAMHYGRFLRDILAVLHSWHADEKVFRQEALKNNMLPGLRKRWPTVLSEAEKQPVPDEDLIPYEDFRHVLFKWHSRMLRVRHNLVTFLSY